MIYLVRKKLENSYSSLFLSVVISIDLKYSYIALYLKFCCEAFTFVILSSLLSEFEANPEAFMGDFDGK